MSPEGIDAQVSNDVKPAAANTAAALLPLCVDLDGTLVRTDTLIEMALATIKRDSGDFFRCLPALFSTKAAFKAALARLDALDVQTLPYNQPFVDYLITEKKSGRQLVLATASNRQVAERIAGHLGIFDDVIASDETHNLRGAAKADVLAARFGASGFIYAGNDEHDLPVWEKAAGAIVVQAPDDLSHRISCPVQREFPDQSDRLTQLLKVLRPHQWVKNLLVFVPVLTANAIGSAAGLMLGLTAFVCFSLVASGVYVLNDLLDLGTDRLHPAKRNRPFAAGALPLKTGLILGPLLALTGLVAGFAVATPFGGWLLVYLGVNYAYSTDIKKMSLIDTFTLAALYTLRIVAGGAATGFTVSVWLLNFSGFLFLSLALLKRYVELSQKSAGDAPRERLAGRGYFLDEINFVQALGIASSFSAAIVLGIYVNSDAARAIYARPGFIWGFVPLILLWQCSVWLAAFRGQVNHDPIVFAVRDRVSWIIAAVAVACYVAASSNI